MTENRLAIEASNISFKYPGNDYYSLDDISVTIKANSCTGIIGPNGAGKSTFISLLCGLIEPEQGKISYYAANSNGANGKDIDATNESIEQRVKNEVALIPQEYAFYPELTIRQNLAYFVALSEKNKVRRKAIIESTLAQCALSDVANKKAQSLSGGYKRRLNIAIALSKQPSIIFLDEPTVGIDPISRQQIIELLVSLKQQGKTLVYTSHMLNEVEQICDDVVLLNHGKAIATSSNCNQNMYLTVEFNNHCARGLMPLLVDDFSRAGSLPDGADESIIELKITDDAHLKRLLIILGEAGDSIKHINFSQNSIDHLYFSSYRGEQC